MGVEVDKARRDQLAAGVDLFGAFARDAADFDNAAVLLIATSASNSSPPRPSAMLPPRITRSGLSVMAFHPEVRIVCRIMGCLAMLSTAADEAQGCISLASGCVDGSLAGRGR